MRAFIAEHCAVDSLLAAIVDELSPDETGIGIFGSQDNLLARSDKELDDAPIGVRPSRIVSIVERETVTVAILC